MPSSPGFTTDSTGQMSACESEPLDRRFPVQAKNNSTTDCDRSGNQDSATFARQVLVGLPGADPPFSRIEIGFDVQDQSVELFRILSEIPQIPAVESHGEVAQLSLDPGDCIRITRQ